MINLSENHEVEDKIYSIVSSCRTPLQFRCTLNWLYDMYKRYNVFGKNIFCKSDYNTNLLIIHNLIQYLYERRECVL